MAPKAQSAPKVRSAAHAGSWYSADGDRLKTQLDRWLDAVPASVPCIGPLSQDGPKVDLPNEGARVIIAPHAGYSFSGSVAAWAYKAVDWTRAKRVFILGPSHHYYLNKCALSQCTQYETPLGNLTLDASTIRELHESGDFETISVRTDEAEHSIEMHLPYIMRMLQRYSPNGDNQAQIIPILVGDADESLYAEILVSYLHDPANVFIISSDFAHWGTRFRYTYYKPADKNKPPGKLNPERPRDIKIDRPIYESIEEIDMECIAEAEEGDYDGWIDVLKRTRNTVCGRHPIGVVLRAMEMYRLETADQRRGRFKFIQYARSGDVEDIQDSSVSYASGFAHL